jgi:hypothetical protein
VSETGFRDLFAELPKALFEVLKGIGEESIKQAQARTPQVHRRPGVATTLCSDPLVGYLCERLGARNMETWREATSRNTGFSARMLCGHKRTFMLDDSAIEDAKSHLIIDLIEDACAAAKRCYCVGRPQ